MASKGNSRRGPHIAEPCPVPYFPIPRRVLESPAYTGATANAIRLLFDIASQHNGNNNGRLQATWAYLSKHRGWSSASRIRDGLKELIERRLLLLTRKGGRSFGQIDYANPPPGEGPDFYAVTWLPISNFRGLDITGKDFWPGAWDLSKVPPRAKKLKGCAGRKEAAVGSGISPNAP